MITAHFESVVDAAALAWLETIGWQIAHGPHIAPDTLAAEQRDYTWAVLAQRLRDALAPRLICGALRVKDVARFIEKATA